MRSHNQKVHGFRVQIRRQEKEKIFKELRFGAIMEQTTEDVAYLMGLDQEYNNSAMSITQLIKIRNIEMVNLPFLIQNNPQKLTRLKNQFQFVAPMSLRAHYKCWKHYSQLIQSQQQLYDAQIGNILIEIVKRYTYEQVHFCTDFECYFLNALSVTCQLMTKGQRDIIMNWICGSEGIRVLAACIDEEETPFPQVNQFPNIYEVISLTLKNQVKKDNEEAALLLQKILLKADLDSTYSIYYKYHGLIMTLAFKLQKYLQHQPTTVFNKAVIYLLDTYDEAILDYTRGGIATTAGMLICSEIDENIEDGLEMMRLISQVDTWKMPQFLAFDNQLRKTGIWDVMCRKYIISRHHKQSIREHYHTILRNLFSNGEKEAIQKLGGYFSAGEYEDLLDMFDQQIDFNSEEVDILKPIMQQILAIMYYASEGDKPAQIKHIFEEKGLVDKIKILHDKYPALQEDTTKILEVIFHQQEQPQYQISP